MIMLEWYSFTFKYNHLTCFFTIHGVWELVSNLHLPLRIEISGSGLLHSLKKVRGFFWICIVWLRDCLIFLFYTLEQKCWNRESHKDCIRKHPFLDLSVATGFDVKTIVHYNSFPTLLLTFRPLKRKWHSF